MWKRIKEWWEGLWIDIRNELANYYKYYKENR